MLNRKLKLIKAVNIKNEVLLCVSECRPQTYKASVGNMRCSRCPRGSMYDEETTERCKCELGLFRLKGDPIGPCNRPRKPLLVHSLKYI